MYGLAEQTVYREAIDPCQGLAIFVCGADTRINQFGVCIGVGLVYTGLLSWHPEDGFGTAAAHNGDRFRRIRHAAGRAVENAKIALELTSRAVFTTWRALQPGLQYITNPASLPAKRIGV